MNEIDIEELINTIDGKKIIDIRDSYLYRLGNIPSSINIPMNFLLMNPSNYLNRTEKYYIYCNYGISSKKVCEKLSNLGYNVVNIEGGYNSYKLFNHKM